LNAPNNNWTEALDELSTRVKKLGSTISAAQAEMLGIYCTQLAAYNEHTNLVAKSDVRTLLFEHVLDAWALVPTLESKLSGSKRRLIDIGSGAGFPGLILAIACLDLEVVLVDSVGKKTAFLTQATAALNLQERIQVLNTRAEELARQSRYRDSFQAATARAVGAMDVVAELCLPFL